MHSLQVENGLSVAHNEEKVKNVSLCFLCSYVKSGRVYANTREKNVFIKPIEHCRACSNIVMARKRTFRGTRKEQSTCPLVFLLTCQFTIFCQLFREKFNIMSTLFIHQAPTLPQKIDSREGLF